MEQIADYLNTLQNVAKALQQLPTARKPLIEAAVEKFVDKVQSDAVQNLLFPSSQRSFIVFFRWKKIKFKNVKFVVMRK